MPGRVTASIAPPASAREASGPLVAQPDKPINTVNTQCAFIAPLPVPWPVPSITQEKLRSPLAGRTVLQNAPWASTPAPPTKAAATAPTATQPAKPKGQRAQGHKVLARRKPTPTVRDAGWNPPREADRSHPGSKFHEPPRSTRYERLGRSYAPPSVAFSEFLCVRRFSETGLAQPRSTRGPQGAVV